NQENFGHARTLNLKPQSRASATLPQTCRPQPPEPAHAPRCARDPPRIPPPGVLSRPSTVATRPGLMDAVTMDRPGLESIAESPAARAQAAILPQHLHRFSANEARERESGGRVSAPHCHREEIAGALML